MARRGIFRRIVEATKSAVANTVEATKTATTTTIQVVKKPFVRKSAPAPLAPFTLKSPDAMFRAKRQQELRERRQGLVKRAELRKEYEAARSRRESSRQTQRKLRAKRKQIEYRKKREGLMVQRSQGSVDDRVQRYLQMNKRDRSLYHPEDAEAEFYRMYDRGL